MGYQPGKGLGRDLQGISAPIEAKVRKGKGAIGLYGPETKGPKLMAADAAAEESIGRKGAQPELNQWRKRKVRQTSCCRSWFLENMFALQNIE